MLNVARAIENSQYVSWILNDVHTTVALATNITQLPEQASWGVTVRIALVINLRSITAPNPYLKTRLIR